MGSKSHIPTTILQQVLLNSKRRCCLCFSSGDTEPKLGAVVHVQADEPASEDNVVFLCFEHHSEFDRTRIPTSAIRVARDHLYRDIGQVVEHGPATEAAFTYEKHVQTILDTLIRSAVLTNLTIVYPTVLLGDSGIPRQVDFVADIEVIGLAFRIAAEAKYRSSDAEVVDVGVIDSFASLIRDIAATKGVVVTNGTFSDAAIRVASRNGISLMRIKEDSTAVEHILGQSFPNFGKVSVTRLPHKD